MLTQTFQMGIIEAEFFINRTKIAETLCENKAKPELQCAGKCQLKKELEKKNEPQSQRPFHEMSCFILPALPVITFSVEPTEKKPLAYAGHFHSQTCISEIFHPPGIAALA